MPNSDNINVMILTQSDFSRIEDAVCDLRSMLWQLRYRREAKLTVPSDLGATIVPLRSTSSRAVGADADDTDY